MNEFDIPIFQKSYELYKLFHQYRQAAPRQERHTSFARAEKLILDIIENILRAGQSAKTDKGPFLEKASSSLNVLRVLVRLIKDVKAIDVKKYMRLQELIDEIGRMLGGWIRSVRNG
ncbi:MAG: diversity-generating retroelement protein Avd [Patescibacteria group bacterium]